ncbi:MAG: carboxypeptidase regulatory-like domain-containing protein [Cytophagales bacterium]
MKGNVLDNSIGYPIEGATVCVEKYLATTDSSGRFMIFGIQPGKYKLTVQKQGFKTFEKILLVDQNIKSFVVYLEEQIYELSQVDVETKIDHFKTLNINSFSATEFKNHPSTFGDPARIVQVLPGVANGNDAYNQVSVRGLSPFNNIWFLNGTEIPNPNHFGEVGSSGGVLNLFNDFNINRFEFFATAFPTPYSNSNSGVFDIYLKKGNDEKKSFNTRISPLGLFFQTDGKAKKTNYNVSARTFNFRPFLEQLNRVVDFPIPAFSDLSYHLETEISKKNQISVYGFAGNSKMDLDYSIYRERASNFVQSHNINLARTQSRKLKLNNTIQLNTQNNEFQKYSSNSVEDSDFSEKSFRNHFWAQFKPNSKVYFKVGNVFCYSQLGAVTSEPKRTISGDTIIFDNSQNSFNDINSFNNQTYVNLLFKPHARAKIVLGYLAHYYSLNKKPFHEPRFSIDYIVNERINTTLSSGIYSKFMPSLSYEQNQRELPPIRSFAFSWATQFHFKKESIIKLDFYYGYLWNVPTYGFGQATVLNSFNLLQTITNKLEKNTNARNFGVELSIDLWTNKNIHVFWAGSLSDSKYYDLSGVLRNKRFNVGHTNSLTTSFDKVKSKQYGSKTVTLAMRGLHVGGFYEVPINLRLSQNNGATVYNPFGYLTDKMPNYFRIDIGVQVSYQRKKTNHIIRLDVQNITNRANIWRRFYDPESQQIIGLRQLPLIPLLSYQFGF